MQSNATNELNGRVMNETLGLNPKYYALKNKHIEKNKKLVKPVEDILIICKIQHVETNKILSTLLKIH